MIPVHVVPDCHELEVGVDLGECHFYQLALVLFGSMAEVGASEVVEAVAAGF